jgi:hypothetical protein
MNLPQDLKRVAQVNAKVYVKSTKQFGNISYYGDDIVKINVGTTKEPYYLDYSTDDFHAKLLDENIVAKARVSMKDDDSHKISIKPRVIMAEPITAFGPPMEIPAISNGRLEVSATTYPAPTKQELTTGYIDEKSGKFSSTLQSGFIEIQYRKVTKKVELELDSVQLSKLKELGII